jgi:hypothetical protein
MDWKSLEETLAAGCDARPDDAAAERAVRAAEIVAATAGESSDELSPDDRDWAETHGVPPDELVELACRAMKNVAAISDEWHARLNDLRYRLGDVAAA